MNNQSSFFFKIIFLLVFLSPGFFYFLGNRAFSNENLLISSLNDLDEKDIQSSFEESDDSGIPTTAGDLMNILKRLESMNDATHPSDAIDDALKAFEREDLEDSSFGSDF